MFLQVSSALIINVPSGRFSLEALTLDKDILSPPIRVRTVLTLLARSATGFSEL